MLLDLAVIEYLIKLEKVIHIELTPKQLFKEETSLTRNIVVIIESNNYYLNYSFTF